MRVCLDVQPAVSQRAGVGRYTRALVEHLVPVAQAHADQLALFYFDFQRRGEALRAPGAEIRAARWLPGRYVQAAWRRFDWPPFDWLAGRADVYHFPNFAVPPLTRGAAVVTIHDLGFLRYPQHAETRNQRYLASIIQRAASRADRIVAVSQFTAHEIAEWLHAPADKLRVIASGLDIHPPLPEAVPVLCRRLGLDRPYLLHVGTLEPRKNLEFLLDVFERLHGFDGDLVLSGALGWKYEALLARIAASPLAARIRRLDYVNESDLPALYAGAALFVIPSHYEGFGFPPLEAMACGTPVLSSVGGSLQEVLGDAALVMPPEAGAADWAAAIEGLLGDDARRIELTTR
ncbi:MAG: glycosyltransferase family 4 protein [Kiritimatiellia bacterium]